MNAGAANRQDGGSHLVLGGSAGIGFAYAAHCAALGGSLCVVAREPRGLERAAAELLLAGASAVSTMSGDLRDPEFRSRLRRDLQQQERVPFTSILVGGPSPPSGTRDEVRAGDMDVGYRTCVAYPLEILHWGLGALAPGGEMIVVGSSASTQPLLQTPFFVSAVFRRVLDELLEEYRPRYDAAGCRLSVWRPHVLLTRLSLAYAQGLSGTEDPHEQLEFLKIRFGVEDIPAAAAYVREQLAGPEPRGST